MWVAPLIGGEPAKWQTPNALELFALDFHGLRGSTDFVVRLMAEREGFEPSSPFRGFRFSRPVRSTALPPFRGRI
jgi:hypothetical protein